MPRVNRAGPVYAVLACCGWGLAFVGPLVLHDWPGLAVAAGRYIAYGLGSLVTLGLLQRQASARPISCRAWRDATLLTLSGNLLYYGLLSVAVQKAGYLMPTLIIGLLPVTVSIFGRLRSGRALTRRYLLALVTILCGLWLAHGPDAATSTAPNRDAFGYGLGLACSFGALALWTGYGVFNSERLRATPGMTGTGWSSLQGVAALPFAIVLFVATPGDPDWRTEGLTFVIVSLVLGLITSLAANAFWNKASAALPPSLLGQMIVFETIAGIGYGALWTRTVPGVAACAGTAILVGGIIIAVTEKQDRSPVPA